MQILTSLQRPFQTDLSNPDLDAYHIEGESLYVPGLVKLDKLVTKISIIPVVQIFSLLNIIFERVDELRFQTCAVLQRNVGTYVVFGFAQPKQADGAFVQSIYNVQLRNPHMMYTHMYVKFSHP